MLVPPIHVAFHVAGIPWVYFGVEDHPDYHRPTDDAERIDAEFLADVAELVLAALRELDASLGETRTTEAARSG